MSTNYREQQNTHIQFCTNQGSDKVALGSKSCSCPRPCFDFLHEPFLCPKHINCKHSLPLKEMPWRSIGNTPGKGLDITAAVTHGSIVHMLYMKVASQDTDNNRDHKKGTKRSTQSKELIKE